MAGVSSEGYSLSWRRLRTRLIWPKTATPPLEGGCGFSGGAVGELEGSGQVAVSSLRRQPDVGFGVGQEAVGDVGGGRDLFEFAGRQESVDVVATPLPGHGVSSGLAGRA
jgi:hypothetical protein